MWVQGLIQGLLGLYLFIPTIIFLGLYIQAFWEANTPFKILLLIFTMVGLIVIFPFFQAFWIDMLKATYKDKEIIDFRFKEYRRKKSVMIKL